MTVSLLYAVSLHLSPIFTASGITSLLASPQTTPATPTCCSSRQEFPTPTGHLHLNGCLVSLAHDTTQLLIPLFSTNLLLLSPLPIHLIVPPSSPSPRTLKSSSSPSPLSQTTSSRPVLLVLPLKLFHQHSQYRGIQAHPLPLAYCNSHLACLHASRVGFVKHRLSHIISPEEMSRILCLQDERQTPWGGTQDPPQAVPSHVSRPVHHAPGDTSSFLRARAGPFQDSVPLSCCSLRPECSSLLSFLTVASLNLSFRSQQKLYATML